MPSEMLHRQRVTRLTMIRFSARPRKWGSADCIAMGRFHLAKAGVTVPAMPQYKSLKGALTALKRRGCDTLEQLVDTLGLERIPAAMMRMGDIAVFPHPSGLDTLAIAEGQMMFGYHDDDLSGAKMVVPFDLTGIPAWRVPFA